MQEEILIKKSRSGTTIHYFNTDVNENNYSTSTVPAAIKLSSTSKMPIELNTFDRVSLDENSKTVLWKRNVKNSRNEVEFRQDYIFGTYLPNSDYITGRTFSTIINSPISTLGIDTMRNAFIASMNSQFTAGTTSYVFFEETLVDDFYANIKLERTFDTLNTLNVYNKVTGNYPVRESDTGVVFGKLEAIQKIADSEGNKIRIPLRNVPIGVFVSSDDFQTPNDLDSNGNRIRLNYRPLDSTSESYATGSTSQYFNQESALFDSQFLEKAPLVGIDIHPTFKNVVYTNQNGEFILHNIAVGPQILFFEVDLLKQGLTKDEVALNYFPYPANYENTSVDTVPHYFYRALPIDVVPSWGVSYQTGYTEVDVSINLDLRKWATYIFPPISYKGLAIDTAEYQNLSKAPITVQVRDMSKFDSNKLSAGKSGLILEAYPSKGIQVVEIENILDKNANQQWEWANEFSQIKDRVLFYSYGYHGIKLPANIYDDSGYKTDKFGQIQDRRYSQGVWLCGYQLKVFLTKEVTLYRTTGLALTSTNNNTEWYDRDHFHCSLYDNIKDLSTYEPTEGAANSWAKGIELRRFPYQKAWSKDYPEKYSIPKPPSKEIFLKPDKSTAYYTTLRPFIESPRYSDGDEILGYSWVVGGYNGMGYSWANGTGQFTDFATDIIGGEENANMYKYESLGAEPFGQDQNFGCYSNGYWNDPAAPNTASTVVNGERFQRIEAGYGYYLYPSSMPKIVPIPSGLITWSLMQVDKVRYEHIDEEGYHSQETQSLGGWWNLQAYYPHYNSYSVFNRGKSIAMDLGKKLNKHHIVNDRLNIYRIIDGGATIPYDIQQELVPTYTRFIIEDFYFTEGGVYLYDYVNPLNFLKPSHYEGSASKFKATLEIYNTGSEKLSFNFSDSSNLPKDYVLEPFASITFYSATEKQPPSYIKSTLQNINILAKGNSGYDDTNNKFLKTSITFRISANWPGSIHWIDALEQAVSIIYIKDKCHENCVFDATENKDGNIFYANTIWRNPLINYVNIDSDGYPNTTSTTPFVQHTEQMVNFNGICCNPGQLSVMNTIVNGTASFGTLTNRLAQGGSMEFYWSKATRVNPHASNDNGTVGQLRPVMQFGNYANYKTWWENPLCGEHLAADGSITTFTNPGY